MLENKNWKYQQTNLKAKNANNSKERKVKIQMISTLRPLRLIEFDFLNLLIPI
jgi:hypothetical protein